MTPSRSTSSMPGSLVHSLPGGALGLKSKRLGARSKFVRMSRGRGLGFAYIDRHEMEARDQLSGRGNSALILAPRRLDS